jgi:membrane-associated phospholipid phosphatase
LRGGRFALVLTAAYVMFTITYVSINVFSVGRAASTLFLPGEERVPFLPVFGYFYVLSYFVGPLVFFSVRDYATLSRVLRATALALAVAYASYLVLPVYMERPRLEVTSPATWLLSLVYRDEPYNDFPSLHVTLAWLAVLASQVSRRWRIVLVIAAMGICISTIFVKQHYVVDVLYGSALAWAAWRVVTHSRPSVPAAAQHQQRRSQ